MYKIIQLSIPKRVRMHASGQPEPDPDINVLPEVRFFESGEPGPCGFVLRLGNGEDAFETELAEDIGQVFYLSNCRQDAPSAITKKHSFLQIQICYDYLAMLRLGETDCESALARRFDAPIQVLRMYQLLSQKPPDWLEQLQSHLATFLKPPAPKKTPAWFTSTVTQTERRCSETLSLNSLSKYAGVNPTTLSKSFPKYTGYTFRQYVQLVRVRKAMQLMRHSSMTLTQIAYDCGFADQSHFSRAFRHLTGLRPKKFQKL